MHKQDYIKCTTKTTHHRTQLNLNAHRPVSVVEAEGPSAKFQPEG